MHDADQAEKLLGTRDAPIHGPMHLSQFTPLLLEVFGHEWFARGTISVHFRKMVSHLVPVQAHIEPPPAGHAEGRSARVWLTFKDGSLALEGTASLGDAPGSMVASQIAKVKPPKEELIIMKGVEVGQRSGRVKVCIRDWDMDLRKLGHGTFPYTVREKLAIITEPHPWFTETGGKTSPWGRAVVPPCVMHAAMYPQRLPRGSHPDSVGLLGGCELRMVNGPIYMGEEYEVQTEVIALGETPRTEFQWTRSTLYHGETVVGYQDLQSMSLKNSFPGPAHRGYKGEVPKAKL